MPGRRNTGQALQTLQGRLSTACDGTLLATASEDTTARLWDPTTRTWRATLRGTPPDPAQICPACDAAGS